MEMEFGQSDAWDVPEDDWWGARHDATGMRCLKGSAARPSLLHVDVVVETWARSILADALIKSPQAILKSKGAAMHDPVLLQKLLTNPFHLRGVNHTAWCNNLGNLLELAMFTWGVANPRKWKIGSIDAMVRVMIWNPHRALKVGSGHSRNTLMLPPCCSTSWAKLRSYKFWDSTGGCRWPA